MSEELELIYDPAKFSYPGLTRPQPEQGKIYDAPDIQFLPEVPYRPLAWLESVLQQGEVRGADVNRQAGELGITKKMLRRARKVLHVAIRREGTGEKTTSHWSLPGVSRPE